MARLFTAASSMYADHAVIAETGAWSIGAWVNATSLPAAGMIVLANANVAGDTYQYYVALNTNGSIECGMNGQVAGNSQAFSDTAAGVLTTGAWHHILATSDGTGNNGSFGIYFDGVSQGLTASGTSGTIPSTANCGNTAIGRFGSDNATFMDGSIADVAVWHVVLSSANATSLANKVRPSSVQFASLDGWWKLDGAASPEPDSSGNGLSMTLHNGPTPSAGPFPIGITSLNLQAVQRVAYW